MDFQDLHAFFHVARTESFSRAASELRTAQSALSRRVARLEHRLGVKLLDRHARGVSLTAEGRALHGRALSLMRNLADIEADMLVLAQEPVGTVTIGLTPATGQTIAPVLIEECRKRLPRVTLQLREGFSSSIHEWLAGGTIDLALLYDPESFSELSMTPLLNEPLYLIGPGTQPWPEWCRGDNVRPADLARLPLILPARSHPLRIRLERLAAEHRITLQVVNQVEGVRTTGSLVAKGLGFTVFSHAGVHAEIAAGTLRAVPFDPVQNWRLALVRRRSGETSRAMTEVEALVESQTRLLVERGLWHGTPLAVAPKHSRGRNTRASTLKSTPMQNAGCGRQSMPECD